MTNYYLLENGIITQLASFKFDEKCLETQDEIIRDALSGQLLLKSELDKLTQTSEYQAKVEAQENAAKKTELISKIEEIDKKRTRACLEPSVKDESTGLTWLGFYNAQIADLTEQLSEIN